MLFFQARGIYNTCQRVSNVCADDPCGPGAVCLDRWSTYMCRCPGGHLAPDCGASLNPAAFTKQAYVEFLITEQHRRRQLLPQLYQRHSRWSRDAPLTLSKYSRDINIAASMRSRRQVVSPPPKSLSFQFRTLSSDGVLLHAATNNDYTLVEVRGGNIQYTSKLGANQPVNMTIIDSSVNDGVWHNLTLLAIDGSLKLYLDDAHVGDELDLHFVHDFLDAYLTSLTLGAAPRFSGTLPYTPEGKVNV